MLRRRTDPIAELVEALRDDAELLELLERRYFKRQAECAIMTALHLARRSYFRRRDVLVNKAASFLFGTLGRYWERRLSKDGTFLAKTEGKTVVLS